MANNDQRSISHVSFSPVLAYTKIGRRQAALTARKRTGTPSTMSEVDLPPVRGQLLAAKLSRRSRGSASGGPADALFLPADADDLAQFLAALPASMPVLPIGVGSNLIVRDGGVAGVVIRLAGRAFAQIEPLGDEKIKAGAGALNSMVAKGAANAGIAGLEFYVGVPGTIGGALTMNAGLLRAGDTRTCWLKRRC